MVLATATVQLSVFSEVVYVGNLLPSSADFLLSWLLQNKYETLFLFVAYALSSKLHASFNNIYWLFLEVSA